VRSYNFFVRESMYVRPPGRLSSCAPGLHNMSRCGAVPWVEAVLEGAERERVVDTEDVHVASRSAISFDVESLSSTTVFPMADSEP